MSAMLSMEVEEEVPSKASSSNDNRQATSTYRLLSSTVAVKPIAVSAAAWTSLGALGLASLLRPCFQDCLNILESSDAASYTHVSPVVEKRLPISSIDGTQKRLVVAAFQCTKSCVLWWHAVLLHLVVLGPLWCSASWILVRFAGASSRLIPAWPILYSVSSFWFGDHLWLLPVCCGTIMWIALVFCSAKRRFLFCVLGASISASFTSLGWILFLGPRIEVSIGHWFMACALALHQVMTTILYIGAWVRLRGDCSSLVFSTLVAFVPMVCETVRLLGILAPASEIELQEKDIIHRASQTVVFSVFAQLINRLQLFDAVRKKIANGSTFVATPERDLFLRAFFGFSYVPLYAVVVFMACPLTGYSMRLKSRGVALILSLLWLVGAVVTDLIVVLAHRNSCGEPCMDVLERLKGPQGHVAPCLCTTKTPRYPRAELPTVTSIPEEEWMGFWVFGPEAMAGIFLATWSVGYGLVGTAGTFLLG